MEPIGEQPWDGVERRRSHQAVDEVGQKVVEAIQSVTSHPADVFQSRALTGLIAGVLIGVTVVIIILVNQFRMADNLKRHKADVAEQQRQIVCLLLVAPEQRSNDVLARCGLVEIPGE